MCRLSARHVGTIGTRSAATELESSGPVDHSRRRHRRHGGVVDTCIHASWSRRLTIDSPNHCIERFGGNYVISKSNTRRLITEIGWYLAEGGAGIASTHVPFDGDFWAEKRLQRQTDHEFSELVEAANIDLANDRV